MTGYEALRSKAAWFDVSDRGKIRVLGEDSARLLHAMSTNDIKNLADGAGVYAFFLTDKGRILADAYIYRRGNDFLLDTEPETATLLREHLDRYIIADDVTLEDETAAFTAIALEGPGSMETAVALSLPIPASVFGTIPFQNGFVARVSVTGAPGLRIFLPMAEMAPFTVRLDLTHVVEANPAEVRLVRLENGAPRFGEDISSRYLVQETQIGHAVHANKGCYLGQEIVERVRAQGQVHRLIGAGPYRRRPSSRTGDQAFSQWQRRRGNYVGCLFAGTGRSGRTCVRAPGSLAREAAAGSGRHVARTRGPFLERNRQSSPSKRP